MGGLFHIKYYKNTEICHITSCAYPLLGTKLFRLKFPRSCSNTPLCCPLLLPLGEGAKRLPVLSPYISSIFCSRAIKASHRICRIIIPNHRGQSPVLP